MTAAAISIDEDLRVHSTRFATDGDNCTHAVQDYGKILKHDDIANKL
jgi:hypothetical protein